jgi:hypothetical protein
MSFVFIIFYFFTLTASIIHFSVHKYEHRIFSGEFTLHIELFHKEKLIFFGIELYSREATTQH